MELILKQGIVEKIQSDADLFAKVAILLGVKPVTLPRILADNKPRLTQAAMLKTLRDHLGITDDTELLTEAPLENTNVVQ